MRKLLLLIFPLYIFAIDNPYVTLDKNEKVNVMVNHFLNQSLKDIKPPLPIKKELKDDGATLDPVKYELYFSYIQRLKAIRESRAEEQISIDEEYAGKIGFYNGKLKALKREYSKKENLMPILKESVNKAFKVVYGKPTFKDIVYDSEINVLKAKLDVDDLYGIDTFDYKDVEIFMYEGMRDDFIKYNNKADLEVRFDYDGEYLQYKDILFIFDDNEYVAKFLNKTNQKIKLNIKINDDIFHPIKIKRD